MEQLKVYVIATGIKKRCRKESQEMIKLGYVALDADRAALKAAALPMISEVMKSCRRAYINFDVVKIEKHDGYESEEWRMFDPRHVREKLIA